jgi:hypothetical protein
MKKRIFVGISMAVLATSLVSIAPASAGSFCNNGSYSSNSGRGTCSYNGGVNKNYPSYSDPGSSSFKRNNGFGSSLSNSFGSNSNYSPSYGSSRNNGFGSSRNNGFGSSRNNGFGSTSSWGNSLSSNSYCTGLFC